MSMTIIVVASIAISLAGAVALFRFARPRARAYRTFSAILGTLPLAGICLALSLTMMAFVFALTAHAGEHHDVMLHPLKGGSGDCTYTWPSSSADTTQRTDCPPDVFLDPLAATATCLPGTSVVLLLDNGKDVVSELMFSAALSLALLSGIGVARNAIQVSRREADARQRATAQWHRIAATAERAAGDYTWAQLAERSETVVALCEPLVYPEQFTELPTTDDVLPMTYPYAYVRVATHAPDGRSAVLLFVDDDAWLLETDGPIPREGMATVSRVPSKPSDLQVTVDGYTYDITDSPRFLPARALEALRRHCNRWLAVVTAPDRPQV